MFVLLGANTPVADLTIGFDGVRSNRGLLQICVTGDPEHFPSCVGDRRARTITVAADTRAIDLGLMAQGDYAVAVIHDENGNRRLDTFAGIPREGYGFSRNPPIGFGAPRFAAARFSLDDAEKQQVRMRYIL